MENRYLLAIDAGTTSFKAALFTPDGALAAVRSQDYTLLTPAPNRVELPAQVYWQTLCTLVRALLAQAGITAEQILSLAISSQGETLICLDEAGQPVGNTIVWLDNRAEAQADCLRERFGQQQVYERTGQSDVTATWTACKILWLKENAPERFARTAKFLLLEDYLLYRLTGQCVCEENLLCSSMLYDIRNRCWWEAMLDAVGITPSQLPKVLPCGTPVGKLTAEAARDTGLCESILAVTGALDQTCGTVGAGAVLPGSVTETTGSCLAVCANVPAFPAWDPEKPITCQNSAVPGRYMVMLFSQTAGMVLKWFTKNFYPDTPDAFLRVDAEAQTAPPGCDGMVMLPHLSGAANPEFDPNAKGVFYGVTLGHGRPHFARSILEAVAFMLRRNLEQMEDLEFDTILSMGGGAKSPLWNRIKADVTGKTICPVKNSETACLGAAMLAAVGAGLYLDLDSAVAGLGETGARFDPDPALKETYNRAYSDYLQLYDHLKPMFHNKE